MTIAKMRLQYAAGKNINQILADADLADADPEAWRKILSAKPRKHSRRAGSTSRKQNHAANVVGRAMAALVSRVNEVDENTFSAGNEIPFMGEPVVIADDGNGLAVGVDY